MSKLAQSVSRAVKIQRQGAEEMLIGLFTFTAKGLADVAGSPKFDDWHVALTQLQRIESGVQFWIGDMLNYGEKEYGEKYAQAVDEAQADTWRTYAWVSNGVEMSIRIDNLSWTHHREVAKFEPERQRELLREASRGSLSVSEFKQLIRGTLHADKVAAIACGELPSGVYDVACADPPWAYDNSGFQQSAAEHYPVMDDAAICALPSDPSFPKFSDESVLFLWATSPRLPSAHDVMNAWGFDYKACMVWVKDRAPGVGWWLKTRHELLLIGARGSSLPQEKIDSVVQAAVADHSRKPAEAYAAIERMFPGLRRIEIFARDRRDGWEVWGNEV